jgi:hypothetical protein
MERHSEILAKGSKLRIVRRCLFRVLVKIPLRSLKCAKHLVAGGEESVKALIPGLKKRTIKGGVMSDELCYPVGSAIGS